MMYMEAQEKKAIELLREIVEWWDKWNNSDHPADMENPPIEEAKIFLAEIHP